MCLRNASCRWCSVGRCCRFDSFVSERHTTSWGKGWGWVVGWLIGWLIDWLAESLTVFAGQVYAVALGVVSDEGVWGCSRLDVRIGSMRTRNVGTPRVKRRTSGAFGKSTVWSSHVHMSMSMTLTPLATHANTTAATLHQPSSSTQARCFVTPTGKASWRCNSPFSLPTR